MVLVLHICNRCKADEAGCTCRSDLAISAEKLIRKAILCQQTILEASSFSRDYYILRGLRQNAGDIDHTISVLTDRRDQLLSDAIHRAESSQNQASSILKYVEGGDSQPSLTVRTEAEPILNVSITDAAF